MSKRKKGNYLLEKQYLLAATIILIVLCSILGFIFWYQSRKLPSLAEEAQMTALPPDFNHVLGAKTDSKTIQKTFRIPIFMYHYVEYVHDDPGKQNLNIPPNIFTSQIETLKNAGYTFITPDDLVKAIAGKVKISSRSAMLSFDDGHMDLYTDVFPILQKEKVKAVAYIITNYLDRPDYLFTFQLKLLAKSSLIEIGAHTLNHPGLAGMSTPSATLEIAQSRKVLQDMLHVPVNSFAYPYGSFDKQTIEIVKNAGYTNAVSVIPGIIQSSENQYYLNRLRPGYRTGEALLKYLEQTTFQPW